MKILFFEDDILLNEIIQEHLENEGYHVNGIEKSCILEIAWDYNGVSYTSEVIERGVYLLSNFILAMLYHYNNE